MLLAQACALLWSGRAPRVVLLVGAALPALIVVLAPGGLFSLTVLATAVAVFLAVLARPDRRTGVVAAVGFGLVVAGHLASELRLGDLGAGLAAVAALLQAGLIVGGPAAVGVMIAARRDARAARLGELAALDRERETAVRAAAAHERTAMSRELHDIAAHHMSGIALMAAAIDRQIDTDPEAAKQSAAQIRQQSRSVLTELRRVVGLLREDGDDTRAARTVPAVRELVDARRPSGAEVELVVHAGPDGRTPGDGLGALAHLVVYRMVQESMANVAAHAAGARCVVSMDDRGERLVVTVVDDGETPTTPGGRGGFGLLGMRERADMIGADLTCGPTDGGWLVRLAVPRAEPTDGGDG
ncbi:hypothetical protein A6035_05725 [Dietzia lutea]|uniref:histidine kinase n=1 Tax=Dietzia lutea TaxID=546160 RepID=A0A2S1R625_9ACTN|nr:hypothetical protein A6035_05725 [Dietzia lutea]